MSLLEYTLLPNSIEDNKVIAFTLPIPLIETNLFNGISLRSVISFISFNILLDISLTEYPL